MEIKIFEASVENVVISDTEVAEYLDSLNIETPYTDTQIEWGRDEIYSRLLSEANFKEIKNEDISIGLINPQLHLKKDGTWGVVEFHNRPTRVEYYIEIHNYNPLLEEESPLPYLFDREDFIDRIPIYPLFKKKRKRS